VVDAMIILFEVNEKKFNTLGLGVLTDAISCHVKEKLLDEFTIEMRYPVKGKHFSKIQYDRIIYCKPNPYDEAQPFRIIFISKPIKGEITIDAVHISYDLNNIPMNAFSSSNLQDLINKIQNEALITHDFKFSSEVMSVKTYKTTSPYNLRAILMGGDNSVVSEYDAELKFNNFLINIMPKRGKNRGAIVRYGHNMTDINHDISTELLYNGVFPFYHRETEKNEVSTNDSFTQVYIVGSKPLQDGWLSFSRDGQPYHPLDTTPVQIASEGDYFQKVYVWDDIYNVYREKVYNQAVTLIQGVLEPDWIRIDWSAFPNVICKAGKKGYFKLATDTDWGDIKGVGDTIFEESIISSGIIENMIIYYSEVIPNNKESTNSDTTEIVDVQLDEKILWLDTKDALAMKYTKILSLDLTSEFEEEPSKERLLAKAEEFINKNKIGTIKHTTKVSFIDLASTTEKSKYENFDHIELGDTVKIVYEDANISVDLRVISTQYDAILNKYESIELGEKKDTMSSESIQNGDNVSSLTNDVGYATVTTVNKLIADVVTANYIEALNAKLTQAQISELEVQRINVKGILEASQFSLDSLIARLLVAENADIAKTLTAGSIKVSGDISIKSGEIRLASEDGTTLFTVDREGNVTANAIEITGGTLNINDGVFEVTNEGVLTAKHALIEGEIKATTGQIGGFKIQNENLYTKTGLGSGVFISKGSEDKAEIGGSANIDGWVFAAFLNFGVTNQGHLYAYGATISGTVNINDGSINLGHIEETDPKQYRFRVDNNGNLYATSAHIQGDVEITSGSINLGYIEALNEYNFSVTSDGIVTIKSGSINLGYSEALHEYKFNVTSEGIVTIKSGSIKLGFDGTDSSNQDDGIYIDSSGNVQIGYNSSENYYYFQITSTGDVRIGKDALIIGNNGSINIGGLLVINQEDEELNLGFVNISGISNCDTAKILTLDSNEILADTIYLGASKNVEFKISSSVIQTSQTVTFDVSLFSQNDLIIKGIQYHMFNVRVIPDQTIRSNTTVTVTVHYIVTSEVGYPTPMNALISKTMTISLPAGTTTSGVSKVLSIAYAKYNTAIRFDEFGSVPPQTLYYNENIDNICEIKSYGPIKIYTTENDSYMVFDSKTYMSLKMFGHSYNLNRQGLFISSMTTAVGAYDTLFDTVNSLNYFAVEEYSDTKGPWELQVVYVPSVLKQNSYGIQFSTSYHIFGALWQEESSANNSNMYDRVGIKISDYLTGQRNQITLYNNSSLNISGWLWILYFNNH
jgi:hypothetical protein